MTALDREIAEQPAALARLLARLPAEVTRLRELATGCTGVTLVARGSSDNAARYGQYLIPIRSGLPVTLATPSLTTVYGRTPDLGGQLVVAVSQSGVSTDVIAVLAAAREQGRPTVAITNDPASPLAEQADTSSSSPPARNWSVAATKTYTTSLAAVAGLAVALARPRRRPPPGPSCSGCPGWSPTRSKPPPGRPRLRPGRCTRPAGPWRSGAA